MEGAVDQLPGKTQVLGVRPARRQKHVYSLVLKKAIIMLVYIINNQSSGPPEPIQYLCGSGSDT